MASSATLLFLSLLQGYYCFNIDTKFPIVKQISSRTSYFGYSVAQHALLTEGGVHDRIIVGAPLAMSDKALLKDYGQTGALYSCPVDINNNNEEDCTEMEYPDTSTTILAEMSDDAVENKTAMWLGVNVRSGGAGQLVVGCGHRYKVLVPDANVYGIGICYLYNGDLTKLTQYSPCLGKDMAGSVAAGFGICSAGMALDLQKRDMLFGLPGSRWWKGGNAWYRPPQGFESSILGFQDQNVEPSDSSDVFSYLGSSVIIVDNLENEGKKSAISGAPRQSDTGAVYIYTTPVPSQSQFDFTDNALILKGQQFGSSFGHSMAVVDIKNDQHPSLVVSAPFYRSEEDGIPDGAVYIYYNLGNGIKSDNRVLLQAGSCSKWSVCGNAQYGYAMVSLGDVNDDNYNDLAVGAPYYGAGIVYIYNGMDDGKLNQIPSQTVEASELNKDRATRHLSGFGISLSGGHDMDGQGSTDLLVGAHKSSQVVVLRSRPVVSVTTEFKLSGEKIDPEDTGCDGQPCVSFSVCYTATAPKLDGDVKISYELTADSGDLTATRRVSFNTSHDQSVKTEEIVLTRGSEICTDETIYISHVRDILKPIQLDLTYELVLPPNPTFENMNAYPVIDETTPHPQPAIIEFKKECKTNNCVTDLGVEMKFADPDVTKDPLATDEAYAFNSDQVDLLELVLEVSVDSSKDPAYDPEAYVHLPVNLPINRIESNYTAASCTSKGNIVICNFGRKLPPGSNFTVSLFLIPGQLTSAYQSINVTVNTTSPDVGPTNDASRLRIKVFIVTDLELLGSADIGDRVSYGGEVKGASAMKTDADIGSLVQHKYTLLNSGSGLVSRVSVTIQWPYEIQLPGSQSGAYLLYMITQPQIDPIDYGQCSVTQQTLYINSLELTIVDNDDSNPDEISYNSRLKRDAPKKTSAVRTVSTDDGQTKKVAMLNCLDGTAKCFNITCQFFNVQPGATIYIRLNARLWNSSLVEAYGDTVSSVEIRSQGELHIDKSIDVLQKNIKNDKTSVLTLAEPDILDPDEKVTDVPIWVIIVAACGGLLVLIIIILIMWKCGFFKRHRPMTFEVKVEKNKNSYKEVPQADAAD